MKSEDVDKYMNVFWLCSHRYNYEEDLLRYYGLSVRCTLVHVFFIVHIEAVACYQRRDSRPCFRSDSILEVYGGHLLAITSCSTLLYVDDTQLNVYTLATVYVTTAATTPLNNYLRMIATWSAKPFSTASLILNSSVLAEHFIPFDSKSHERIHQKNIKGILTLL